MMIATIRTWLVIVFAFISRKEVEIMKPKRHRFTVIGIVEGDEVLSFSFNVLAESADSAAHRVYKQARKMGIDARLVVNTLIVPGWNKVILSV